MRYFNLIFLMIFIPFSVAAQFASKKISKKEQAYVDSLKQIDYPYLFPIWGQKIYQKGFDIPYPAGIMTNFMWIQQGILIDNMQLGLKTESVDIPLTPVDFIEFGDNTTTAYTANIRPDLWIFPFLNVYGLFGYGSSETEVMLTEPLSFTTNVTQGLSTLGFGIMGAFGIGPLWMSVDWNHTWNKPDLLEEAVKVNVLGLRLGTTLKFKNKPERNIAFWLGAMRLNMESETRGEITLIDALPQDFWDNKDQKVAEYEVWREANYDDLTPQQKVVVNNLIDPLVEAIDNRKGDSTVRYGMDKSPSQMWNGVIGGQFQLNKKWMLRTEFGVFGDRSSALLSFNYRFLL